MMIVLVAQKCARGAEVVCDECYENYETHDYGKTCKVIYHYYETADNLTKFKFIGLNSSILAIILLVVI